jgi:hypothetical protein
MNKDEALRLALEALGSGIKTQFGRLDWIEYDIELVEQAITAIKAALEAKDEPVALKPCAYESKEKKMCRKCGQVHAEAIWDTTPPQRKPLSDEEIDKAMAENKQTLIDAADNYWKMRRAYARIIEAAHGIKELP